MIQKRETMRSSVHGVRSLQTNICDKVGDYMHGEKLGVMVRSGGYVMAEGGRGVASVGCRAGVWTGISCPWCMK